MRLLLMIITIILQVIVGQILGFGGAMTLGVGNGVELVVIPLGNVLGVWGVGALMARLRSLHATTALMVHLVGALLGAALGTSLILVTPATGFGQLLYPLLGALLGYYLAPLFMRAKR